MGWEKRERGRLYYTRSRKENGRVIRNYLGRGELAALIAHATDTRRRIREERAAALEAFRKQTEEIEAPLEELCEASDLLVEATLLASGYHRHKREWRKRREPKKKAE